METPEQLKKGLKNVAFLPEKQWWMLAKAIETVPYDKRKEIEENAKNEFSRQKALIIAANLDFKEYMKL